MKEIKDISLGAGHLLPKHSSFIFAAESGISSSNFL